METSKNCRPKLKVFDVVVLGDGPAAYGALLSLQGEALQVLVISNGNLSTPSDHNIATDAIACHLSSIKFKNDQSLGNAIYDVNKLENSHTLEKII